MKTEISIPLRIKRWRYENIKIISVKLYIFLIINTFLEVVRSRE